MIILVLMSIGFDVGNEAADIVKRIADNTAVFHIKVITP